jgi:MtN3 and saliva related transmembrane protein
MKEIYINLFGILSTICYTTSVLPQIIKIINTKKVEDISLLFLITCIMGEAFYIVYGNFKDIGNIIFSAYISIVLHFILVILWFSYKKKSLKIEDTNTQIIQTNDENIVIETII